MDVSGGIEWIRHVPGSNENLSGYACVWWYWESEWICHVSGGIENLSGYAICLIVLRNKADTVIRHVSGNVENLSGYAMCLVVLRI